MSVVVMEVSEFVCMLGKLHGEPEVDATSHITLICHQRTKGGRGGRGLLMKVRHSKNVGIVGARVRVRCMYNVCNKWANIQA